MKKPDLNDNIGFLLNSTTNALNTMMQRAISKAELDVPLEQLKLLMFISFNSGTNQQDICQELNKAKPGISRMVDALVKKDLIEQVQDNEDRRNKKLFVTPNGMKIREQFYPLGFSKLKNLESELGSTQSAELKQHLIAIKQIIISKLNTEE
ncbi:MAG: MarR family winged helix-turn-helix transcriptional regulator [Salibacteraceae bacterium]